MRCVCFEKGDERWAMPGLRVESLGEITLTKERISMRVLTL